MGRYILMLGHKGLMLLMQSPKVLTTLYHFPLALHHSICFTSHTTSHYTCTFSPSPHAFHPLSHSPLKFPSPCHIWVLSCHSTLNNLNLKLNSKLHKPDGFEFPKFARWHVFGLPAILGKCCQTNCARLHRPR